MRRLIVIASIVLALSNPISALAKGPDGLTVIPKAVEIELAASALPEHLRSGATIYVLNPNSGFEIAQKGTNGFSALVARTGDDAMRGDWSLKEYPKDILYPVSFDAAGAKSHLQIFLDIASMQARDADPNQVKKTIKSRIASGYYPAVQHGVSYMLSPILRTYFNPEKTDEVATMNMPHLMFYAPNEQDGSYGANELAGRLPFVTMPGPQGYLIQMLGREEQERITKSNEILLGKLCALNALWCINEHSFKAH